MSKYMEHAPKKPFWKIPYPLKKIAISLSILYLGANFGFEIAYLGADSSSRHKVRALDHMLTNPEKNHLACSYMKDHPEVMERVLNGDTAGRFNYYGLEQKLLEPQNDSIQDITEETPYVHQDGENYQSVTIGTTTYNIFDDKVVAFEGDTKETFDAIEGVSRIGLYDVDIDLEPELILSSPEHSKVYVLDRLSSEKHRAYITDFSKVKYFGWLDKPDLLKKLREVNQ